MYKLDDTDKVSIKLAFEIASDYYRNEVTKDGKPFILYNLDIAIISMKEIGLGPTSAICALLHGINIKTDYSLAKIEIDFGKNVAEIIKGFNSISKLRTERISFQSEAFRTLFLSMVDDMRVILILLAHRLNDLRHIDLLGDTKGQFIDEVKHLYIPIAHRLGLYKVKSEFEERIMKYEHPQIYEDISNKIQQTKAKREVYIQDFIRPIERELHAHKINFEIKWRTKSVPSIWQKMTRQNVDFEEVYDLFAVRIVINGKLKSEKEDCWRVYSYITNIYQPNPKRLRDWISTPKASGYESLHTTVMGPNQKWIEVQIRNVRMDDDAEKGRVAHWQYKGVMNKKNTEDWLSQVRDILENPDQINHDSSYRSEKQQENVFVFTPLGDLKQLPKSSTVLDFAFGIHTDIGARCSGAKVNNKVVPIRYVLQNGDKVDILTAKNQKPKLDWLSFVTTDKARTRIKRHLKEDKYQEADNGKSILFRKFKNWKIKSNDDLINFLVKHYKLDASIDLYYLVATEKIDLHEIKGLLLKFVESSASTSTRETTENGREQKYSSDVTTGQPKLYGTQAGKQEENGTKDVLYIGDNLKNIDYRMAKCCNPIPGDNVFGFITTHGGITIHRANCPNAKRLRAKYEYRVLKIQWVTSGEEKYSVANLRITGTDELGVVGLITKVITEDLRVNIRSINFQTTGKKFIGKVTVSIKNNEHLEQLIHKINKVKGVDKALRIK
ncbi:MAG: bifunctional (p)ppGpp synthetase/guanosine-3',5'-bis(diphosphate) 3'-pyrophosphohydrolase [Bacteroidales bacterium]|nr:bifunctional (p)ppGpp synthetase/guanosine-3',5'-bis(diphosphate) 3'-pyrophosphohydrolase [Bacteroidales bacterium]